MVQWKSTRKYAKRTVAKAGKFAKKRYFKGKGYSRPKITAMVSDINKLKHLLNVEKKIFLREERTPIVMGLTMENTKTTSSIEGEGIYAQRDNVLYSGAYCNTNIIGTPTRGTGDGQLIGDRAKIVSYHMDYRVKSVRGSDYTNVSWEKARTKVRLYLVLIPRGDQVLTDGITSQNQQETMLMRFFEPSVFDTTYDGTRRNIAYMKDFKVLAQKTITFNHNELNDEGSVNTRFDGIYEGKFGGKCNHHIRYDGNFLLKNRIAMIAIPDTGLLTGDSSAHNHFTLEYSSKFYYVDN
uniref:hypothetical protein n=4 Tax=Pseudomonadati TaxID=3379134 RepID=UPI0040470C31